MIHPRKVAVYPGTFDPITNGHIDILVRSLDLFDHVIVAIASNPRKAPLFSVDQRKEFIGEALHEDLRDRVSTDAFNGLLVEYCRARGATCIVRGLRALADFEYEFRSLTAQHFSFPLDLLFQGLELVFQRLQFSFKLVGIRGFEFLAKVLQLLFSAKNAMKLLPGIFNRLGQFFPAREDLPFSPEIIFIRSARFVHELS